MSSPLTPWSLAWDEVDPRRRPFDASTALATVRALAPASSVPERPTGSAADPHVLAWASGTGRIWADSMTLALVETYGRWACGWHWSLNGGGPVSTWCCPRDSVTTPDETVPRVAASLIEWRGWLEDLADRFGRFPLDDTLDLAVWERAAVHLVHHVADRTEASDAWYAHCAQTLTWFLTHWGIPAAQADSLVTEAIGGRFDSWSAPPEPLLTEVAEHFARSVQDHLENG